MIDAARMKFLPFFYGFIHPIYQEVEYRDLYNRATYPDCISQFMQRNSCFNTSTLDLNHQGCDFCLENKIRRHKMVAPKGIVTNSTWRTISRGLDKIEKVQENAETILGINKSTRYTDTELYNEIVSWRAVLRSSGMLQGSEEEGVLKNIFNEPLPFELDDLTSNLIDKMKEYWSAAASGTPLQSIRCNRIIITQDNTTNDDNDS